MGVVQQVQWGKLLEAIVISLGKNMQTWIYKDFSSSNEILMFQETWINVLNHLFWNTANVFVTITHSSIQETSMMNWICRSASQMGEWPKAVVGDGFKVRSKTNQQFCRSDQVWWFQIYKIAWFPWHFEGLRVSKSNGWKIPNTEKWFYDSSQASRVPEFQGYLHIIWFQGGMIARFHQRRVPYVQGSRDLDSGMANMQIACCIGMQLTQLCNPTPLRILIPLSQLTTIGSSTIDHNETFHETLGTCGHQVAQTIRA